MTFPSVNARYRTVLYTGSFVFSFGYTWISLSSRAVSVARDPNRMIESGSAISTIILTIRERTELSTIVNRDCPGCIGFYSGIGTTGSGGMVLPTSFFGSPVIFSWRIFSRRIEACSSFGSWGKGKPLCQSIRNLSPPGYHMN